MHLADLQILSRGRPAADGAVRRPPRLGAQGDLERRRLGQVFERPHDRAIRRRDLERQAVPGAMNRTADRKRTTPMTISPLAGKPAPKEMLVDVARLDREYY